MASTYLSRNMTTQGSSIKGTFSCWFKLANDNLTGGFLGHYFSNAYNFDICMQLGHIEVADYRTAYILRKRTTAKYRDLNAWYHLYVAIDRSLATASDRCKIYVNGERVTDFQSSEDQDYSQQTSGGHSGAVSMNNDYTARVGLRYGSSDFFDGSISHMHWVDGSVIDISQFGSTDSTTGEWKINTSPTVADYGTNGFLILKDGNTITDQSSGGSYDFSVGGGTLTKTEDNPSNVFATLNPLTNDGGGAKTYSLGNTKVAETANSWTSAHSTLGVTSGKWYFEAKVTYTNSNEAYVGASAEEAITEHVNTTHYLGKTANSVGFYTNNGSYYKGSGAVSWGNGVSSGDIVGCALDLDNNFIYFSKNGTWQVSGDPTSGSSGTGGISLPSGMTTGDFKFFSVSPNESYLECNFGNGYFGTTAVSSAGTNASGIGIFEYDVPTGYTALSTKGLNL